jgi:WD40 repeat protein
MASKTKVMVLTLLTVLPVGAVDKPGTGGQLRQLRFSSEGKYVVAQDDLEITILAADPLSVLFRIPAENATLAEFTPDSQEDIVFVSSITRVSLTQFTIVHGTPRVERWSVHDRTSVASLPLPGLLCGTVSLSPDGRTIACDDFEGTLRVIDAASNESVLEQWKFVRYFKSSRWDPSKPLQQPLPGYALLGDLGSARLEFSPDGRFLLAVPGAEGTALIWDIHSKCLVRLGGGLRVVNRPGRDSLDFLDFVGSDRVLISSGALGNKNYTVPATVVSFPDGNKLSTAKIPWAPSMRRAADPAFAVVVQPYYSEFVEVYGRSHRFKEPSGGAAAVELATGQMITSDTPALDVFGSHYVAEVRPGEVGLYERGKGLQATVVLHKK